jgi:hypothetical protein
LLTTPPRTSFIVEAIRRREAELAEACAVVAASVKDTRVARRLAVSAVEHLRHSRPHLDCHGSDAVAVDTATLRRRVQKPLAIFDRPLEPAIDVALAGAIARSHAEVALFIDQACASLLVAPSERETLLRIAFCTAALGDALGQGVDETPRTPPHGMA